MYPGIALRTETEMCMTYVRQGTGSFVIFCVFVASLLAGCESPEDEGEVCEFDGTLRCTRVAPRILGTYTGSVQDTVAGVGLAQLVLSNRKDHPDEGLSEVSGNWQATFPDPANNTSGLFAGVLGGLLLIGTVVPSDPGQCSFTAQAILIGANRLLGGNRLQGTYTTDPDCAPAHTGTFDLRK